MILPISFFSCILYHVYHIILCATYHWTNHCTFGSCFISFFLYVYIFASTNQKKYTNVGGHLLICNLCLHVRVRACIAVQVMRMCVHISLF